MANTTKLIAGAQGAFSTSAAAGFSAGDLALFNSLATGSCVVASSAIANGTALDLYGEVSISLAGSATTAAGAYVNVFVLPLNQDGTTYGDNTPSGSAQTVVPGAVPYLAGTIAIRPGITSGTALVGTVLLRDLPRGDFKLAVQVALGSALNAAAAATIAYRTTNLNLNG